MRDSKRTKVTSWFTKRRELFGNIINSLTIIAFVAGLLALVLLVWLYVRPIQTADIKVPVATDQSSYSPGEEISGIFFGDTFYDGEVRVLREVFCKNYTGVIKPPAESAVGDFFSTQGKPTHLEGQSVAIGNLPANVPVGANCVLQFTNVYEIQTPFGIRRLEYQYYTQNFSIVSRERRQQLDCEATGSKDCNFIIDTGVNQTVNSSVNTQSVQSSPETPPSNVYNSTTNNTTTNPPAEPAPRYVEQCTINFIIKVNCTQVLVN